MRGKKSTIYWNLDEEAVFQQTMKNGASIELVKEQLEAFMIKVDVYHVSLFLTTT